MGDDSQPTKKRILVVDDSPIFIRMLTEILGAEYIVQTAASGEEAIDLLRGAYSDAAADPGPFDLVITDLDMPGLSGYDVAEYVRGKNREHKFTPVVMLTGMEIDEEEARKHGCAAYVPKTDLMKVKSLSRILMTR